MRAPHFALACAGGLALSTSGTARAQPASAPAPAQPPASGAPAEPVKPPESEQGVDPEPVRTDYAAHPGCPDGQAFLAQILARTARARHAEPSEPARIFVVRIEPHPSGSRGALTVRDATGTQATREVVAATCGEVVAALALVSALAIDPQASTSPIEMLATESPSTAPPPAPIDPGTALPPAPPALATSPGEQPSQLALGIAIGGEAVWGIAPDAVLAPRFFVEVEWRRQELLSPSARLSVARGESTVRTAVGEARLVWLSARLEACPLRIPATSVLGFRPCAGIEAGSLSGEGLTISRPRDEPPRPWLAPLLSARGLWQPAGILVVEAYAGATLPAVPSEFVFNARQPDETRIHEVPPVGAFVGLSVGVSGEVL